MNWIKPSRTRSSSTTPHNRHTETTTVNLTIMSKASDSFTYMDGDHGLGRRWITHDPDDHSAGEFKSESEAKAACDSWNNNECRVVKMDWKESPEDSDDSHRGTYIITIDGTRYRKTVCCGWHSMEMAAMHIQKLRDACAAIGKANFVLAANAFAF